MSSRDLLVNRDGRCTGTRAFSTDIKNVRAFVNAKLRECASTMKIIVLCAI
jgi:hypothetical protein